MATENITEQLLDLALYEDLGPEEHDATTELLFPGFPAPNQLYRAHIVSKHPEPIIICGIALAKRIFERLSPACKIETAFTEGQFCNSGQTLLTITGDPHALLKGERVVLNFLRHLCAIATLTAKYVACVKDTSLKILDTRKTTPGMRQLEKYAVQCGGGVNHRMGLYDAIMIKDTHVDLLGGMEKALQRLPELMTHSLPVIVEVRSQTELACVLRHGVKKVSRVLLDNMSPSLLQACVIQCQGVFSTEASGNIRLSTIREIALTGVNYASVGELTYNAGHVDLSMKILNI